MQKIDLIFTRDFSLFTCEFWRDVLLTETIQKAWGVPFSDQIMHFNGKLMECYRLREEMEKTKQTMLHLPLDHRLLSADAQTELKQIVEAQRRHLDEVEYGKAGDTKQAWDALLQRFAAFYPGYMLANFLPGAFADDFRKLHGPSAEPILEKQFANRVAVEGIFEHTDLVLRQLVAHALETKGLDGTLARLVRFEEAEALIKQGQAPKESNLKARQSGYTLIGGRLILGQDLKHLLSDNNLEFDFPEIEGVAEIKGSPAFVAPPLRGKVQILYTIEDVKEFKPGNILVSPMTAPDFLPAMKQAAAIVTDEGGLTCHAAIVSRELKIPCVIGTKIATKVLKDGMEVKVDATKGIVRIIK